MRAHSRAAVVLGLYDTGLAAVRSLGRHGISVLGVDHRAGVPGLFSRFCTPRICPHPIHEGEDLVAFLLAHGRRAEAPPVLLPSSDAYVTFLSRHRAELSGRFVFALPSADVVEAIVDKRRQYEMALRAGVPCPQTFSVETREDLERASALLEYRAFVKPRCSHLWRDAHEGKGFKVEGPGGLRRWFDTLDRDGHAFIAQSVIPGPNTSHFKLCAYMDGDGVPLAVFVLRKLRQYPTEFGTGSMVESVRHPEVRELGLRLLLGIGYRGVGSVEFKRDERDGELKLIELNPRLWLQNGLAADCGVDFTLVAYHDLCGRGRALPDTYREGVVWLDATNDLKAFRVFRGRGELSAGSYVRSVSRARSFATFAVDDPVPFLLARRSAMRRLRSLLLPRRPARPEGTRAAR